MDDYKKRSTKKPGKLSDDLTNCISNHPAGSGKKGTAPLNRTSESEMARRQSWPEFYETGDL